MQSRERLSSYKNPKHTTTTSSKGYGMRVGGIKAVNYYLYVIFLFLLITTVFYSLPSSGFTYTKLFKSRFPSPRQASMASASSTSQDNNGNSLASRIQDALQAHKRGELERALSGTLNIDIISDDILVKRDL
jgi:hypothetical protein